MKQVIAVFCAACLMAGCVRTTVDSPDPAGGGKPAQSAASASDGVSGPSGAGTPNPVVEYGTPDFTGAAGFAVLGYPADDEIFLSHCALIAGEVAELEFSFGEPGLSATLRIARETGEDISGVYGQRYEETMLEEMDGTVLEMNASAGGPFLARWSKDGYAFTLWMEHAPMGMFGGILPRFLAVGAVPGNPDAGAPTVAAKPGFLVEITPSDGENRLELSLEGLSEPPARCWVIGGKVVQYDWTETFGTSAILRAAGKDVEDISGCYYPAPAAGYGGETREETIDGTAVTLRDCENGNFRADWVKDGIRYHLWLPAYSAETLRSFLRARVGMAPTG